MPQDVMVLGQHACEQIIPAAHSTACPAAQHAQQHSKPSSTACPAAQHGQQHSMPSSTAHSTACHLQHLNGLRHATGNKRLWYVDMSHRALAVEFGFGMPRSNLDDMGKCPSRMLVKALIHSDTSIKMPHVTMSRGTVQLLKQVHI